jgi:phospholipid/cholesterol/gamma-HCH transport system permease protein
MRSLQVTGEGADLALEGDLDIRTVEDAAHSLAPRLAASGGRLDLARLNTLDTPGALYLCGLRDQVQLTGVRDDHQALLDLVCKLEVKPLAHPPSTPRWRELLVRLGASLHSLVRDTRDILEFMGRFASALAGAAVHPSRIRLASISRQVSETGINALPIIGLLAVMIAVVIAYQGIVQLRQFGGEDYTINLVAVSVLREMGVLVTAIIVAGRTGSSFTAEIGLMKAREEIDALVVMGLSPMDMLVIPRMLGLLITLPLLVFFADATALVGAAVISKVLLGVGPAQFIERVHQSVQMSDLFVGLVKAPVFAFIIATIGCMHGLRVGGSAESIGRETTRSVVKSIFIVIVLDALFSVFFERVGL